MADTQQDKATRIAELEQELKDLKGTLPEHCSGTKGFVDAHRASAEHWQRIEDIEYELKKLKG